MAAQLHGSEFYDAITDDVIAAWGLVDASDTIYYGKPRSGPNNGPYAVIRLSSVPMDWVGVRTVEQSYSFAVTYRAPWPTDDDSWNVELAKEDKANAFLSQISQGATYAAIGLMPLLTGVEFDESYEVEERWYELTVTFSVTVHEGV